MRRLFALPLIALWLASFSACGTLPSGEPWGAHAFSFDGQRLEAAAKHAALDPITWTPLIGAGVVAAGDWDRDISNWARRRTPLYGSTNGASDYSNAGLYVAYGEAFATTAAMPSGTDAVAKLKGIGVAATAFGTTVGLTEGLKNGIGRERPDASDNLSMPSGHSSTSFAAIAVTNRNLDYFDIDPTARVAWKATNVALATSVGWARIEAGKHFPTDVLVGAALGNFTTRFIYDAFLGVRPDDHFSIYVAPNGSGGSVSLGWIF